MRYGLAIASALALAGATAAGAEAATVCQLGTTAAVAAPDAAGLCGGPGGASETNSVRIEPASGGGVAISDAGTLTDGDGAGGCTVTGATAVCPGADRYALALGDGNDEVTVAGAVPAGATANLGPGSDRFTGGTLADAVAGGPGADVLDGGAGPDLLVGGDGADGLAGGGGDDVLDGGAAGDTLSGGAGRDTLTYAARLAGVVVTLDGLANDGADGEGDDASADLEVVIGGAGADTLHGADGPQWLDGGPGGDSLNGSAGPDVLSDTGGDGGADLVSGGAGDDVLAAGDGPDVYRGGDGDDALTDYGARVAGVVVSLDDLPGDGEAGEDDNVHSDVEDVLGGTGSDTLTGSAADNQLAGGPGDDSIDGSAGNDGLAGGPGADSLTGGPGSDHTDGGGGDDALQLRDGLPDHAACGGGTDRAEVDARDDAFGDCETVAVAPPAAAVIRSAVVSRAGVVLIDVGCPTVERECAGGVTVKTIRRIAGRVRVLGVASYRVLSGRNALVRSKIGARERAVLRRARRVKVRVIVTNYHRATQERATAAATFLVRTSGLSVPSRR